MSFLPLHCSSHIPFWELVGPLYFIHNNSESLQSLIPWAGSLLITFPPLNMMKYFFMTVYFIYNVTLTFVLSQTQELHWKHLLGKDSTSLTPTKPTSTVLLLYPEVTPELETARGGKEPRDHLIWDSHYTEEEKETQRRAMMCPRPWGWAETGIQVY